MCVHLQQPERSEIFTFSGLSLSRWSNSEKLTRLKIAADILVAFAGQFFTEVDRVALMLFKFKSVLTPPDATAINRRKWISRFFLAFVAYEHCVTIKHSRWWDWYDFKPFFRQRGGRPQRVGRRVGKSVIEPYVSTEEKSHPSVRDLFGPYLGVSNTLYLGSHVLACVTSILWFVFCFSGRVS